MKKVFLFIAFALGLSASVANAQRTPVNSGELIPAPVNWTSNVTQKCFCCDQFYNLPSTPPISGPTSVTCTQAAVFSTTSCPNATYNWSISPAVAFTGNGTSSITVNAPITPGTYTVTVKISCKEKSVTNTHTFTVQEDQKCRPDFTISLNELPNNYQVVATPAVGNGYHHYWVLQEITVCPGGAVTNTGWTLYVSPTGVPSTSNPAITPGPSGYGYQYAGLGKGRCYRLIHYIYCCGQWKRQTKCFCLAANARMNMSEAQLGANTVTENVKDADVPAELKAKVKNQ